MRNRQSRSGFTLIELLIVTAVIAILAVLLVPSFYAEVARAREARATGDLASLAKAVARLRTDTGNSGTSCLTTLTNLKSPVGVASCSGANVLPLCSNSGNGDPCWGGPYLDSTAMIDPWQNPYSATEDATTEAVTVLSNGPDGVSGTADDLTFVQ